MADSKSSGGSWLANPNALLALITVFGGLWLVSHELTSDRPAPLTGDAVPVAGDQKMEARLWEDPFKAEESSGGSRPGRETPEGLATLVEQIRRKSFSPGTSPTIDPNSAKDAPNVLLLPVMISGGQYSEDQESRIRSRYAIVSALGRSEYVPDDAEHLGAIRVPWLSRQQIADARRTDPPDGPLWREVSDGKEVYTQMLGIRVAANSPTLNVRYEWYRPRTFAAGRAGVKRPAILVLWLNDSYFEDDPLLRLGMFLGGLIASDPANANQMSLEVALIGPRRSSTLREMLPEWGSQPKRPEDETKLEKRVREVLSHVTVFNATASAMDEVLVKDAPGEPPRKEVGDKLTAIGFKGFYNFAATDAQMGKELLDELSLRKADLGNAKNHLVLISEWDTFYARILSLTYGAELAGRRNAKPGESATAAAGLTRAKYIEQSGASRSAIPTNFHSFVYLRGLDGQTIGSANRQGGNRESKPKASLVDLGRWKPDANKAEGQAQFDYLGRLGDRVAELQLSLRSKGDGEIKAIGIVGSDVYDTLLILQALRWRFPSVLFFTTDLDVRFFHPGEREWARNLIVVSSYGLTLDSSLQESTPPFRDGSQTAQYAATLAAVGNESLRQLKAIPPRRFEIGNGTVVDLSVSAADKSGFRLHPLTPRESHREPRELNWKRLGSGVLAIGLLLGCACWMSNSLRRLTWRGRSYPGRALLYTSEDIGGPDGALLVLRGIDRMPEDNLAKWLRENRHVADLRAKLASLPAKNPPEVDWDREAAQAELLSIFVGQFNELLRQQETAGDSTLMAIPESPARKGLSPLVRARLDRFLDDAVKAAGTLDANATEDDKSIENLGIAACEAARTARQCAHDLYRVRRRRWQWFWVCVLVFGLLAGFGAHQIWSDTFLTDRGEPFSLVSGTSAWPAAAVRAGVIALALWFGFALWHQTEETFLVLTRQFRFSVEMKKKKHVPLRGSHVPEEQVGDRVPAESTWQKYRAASLLSHRWVYIVVTAAVYYFALTSFVRMLGAPFSNPARGDLLNEVNRPLVMASTISFMLLAFFAVDKAVLCRRFIKVLSTAPTLYGPTTCRHFARQMGRIDDDYLDEWIDLQLIAELTERVGRLIYYPTILLLLLMLSRNSWWDAWKWPLQLLIIYGFNFTVALASIVILQRAAKDAKRTAEQTLAGKVRRLRARVEPSPAANNAARGEEILKEVQGLNRGAFVPFWENPVVGAIFLSSGGTTALQLLIWFVGR